MMTPRQTSRQYQIDKRQEMLDEAQLRQDAVEDLEAREAYDGASRDEPHVVGTGYMGNGDHEAPPGYYDEPQAFVTQVVESDVLGVKAYEATCSCGWETRRFDTERTAAKHMHAHADDHAEHLREATAERPN